MFTKLHFTIVDGNKLEVQGLPPHLFLRGIKYTSEALAELQHLSIASANVLAAKSYMDTIRKMTPESDPHTVDAALLAAIVKYGSVFKPDSRRRSIDAEKIFKSKIVIINRSVNDEPMIIDDPELQFLENHKKIMKLRDKMIAHDDRIIGNTGCFAAFDKESKCEKVIVLTQRSTVYSAIKAERDALPLCIDAVFSWLALMKEHYCQIVNDEINKLSKDRRGKFPEPTFESFRGLSDSEERRSRQDPYWAMDWETGKVRLWGNENAGDESKR
jgi:hypothetical protein